MIHRGAPPSLERPVLCVLVTAIGYSVLAVGCNDTPPPQFPKTIAVMSDAGAPRPVPPNVVSDVPSSILPGEVPMPAPHPALSAQASSAYQQAVQAFSNGDLGKAKQLFEQVIQGDPRAHQGFYSLGTIQERLRDPGAAASYRQAFTLVPDYEPAIVAYAMLLAKSAQLSEAERLLVEKRGQMPKSAAVAATLAEVKSLQKDTGSAQRLAQEALKLNPDYRPAMVVIARDHYRNRRLDLALYALQAILDGFGSDNPPRDKDNGEALLLRGLIWKEQGNRAGALEQFLRALQRRPDLVDARVNAATFLLQAGRAEEALPILEGAVKYNADSLPAHLNLGDAYRLLGRYGEARQEFDWVLAHESALPQAHYDLGLLYLYAPSVPGMTAKQQIAAAIGELKRFQEVRLREERDDSDELLSSARIKEGEVNAVGATSQPPPGTGATPTPTPAASGSGTAAAPSPTGVAARAPMLKPLGPKPEAIPVRGRGHRRNPFLAFSRWCNAHGDTLDQEQPA